MPRSDQALPRYAQESLPGAARSTSLRLRPPGTTDFGERAPRPHQRHLEHFPFTTPTARGTTSASASGSTTPRGCASRATVPPLTAIGAGLRGAPPSAAAGDPRHDAPGNGSGGRGNSRAACRAPRATDARPPCDALRRGRRCRVELSWTASGQRGARCRPPLPLPLRMRAGTCSRTRRTCWTSITCTRMTCYCSERQKTEPTRSAAAKETRTTSPCARRGRPPAGSARAGRRALPAQRERSTQGSGGTRARGPASFSSQVVANCELRIVAPGRTSSSSSDLWPP